MTDQEARRAVCIALATNATAAGQIGHAESAAALASSALGHLDDDQVWANLKLLATNSNDDLVREIVAQAKGN